MQMETHCGHLKQRLYGAASVVRVVVAVFAVD